MKLEKMQDFEVWTKAEIFANAVIAILARPAFVKDFKLRGQVAEAADSILANMTEGFEQPTDRAFAKYLYTSKGSTAETCTRLGRALKRGYVTETELRAFERQGSEIARMLTGLIKHLLKTPTRQRGLGRLTTNDD